MPHSISIFPSATLAFIAALASIGGASIAAAAASSPDEDAPTRPNVLFVFSDDHAWQAISAYGSNRNETPAIDRLAAEGMRFDRFFVGNAICAPARATILTGLHSHANGLPDNGARFDGSQRTLPKMLRAEGYQTALIGKWHLKTEPTGFDHYERLLGQGPYWNPVLRIGGGRDGDPHRDERVEGYTTDIITERALAWLRTERDATRPFLLMVQHKAPHREWQSHPRHASLYADADLPEPDTLFDDWSGKGSAAPAQEMTIANHLSRRDLKLDPPPGLTEPQLERWFEIRVAENEAFEANPPTGDDLVRWKYQRYAKEYLRAVAAVDEGVGALLDELDTLGIADDTLVIYTSDQGWYLGEHGWYDKRWMYEESFRTPFLARWPGVIEPGSVATALSQNIDVAPTLLDAAGLDVPTDMHGRSLLPILRDAPPLDWRRSLYYRYSEFPAVHMVNKHEGVRTDRYKLIHFDELGEWEFYDLARDPDEMRNAIDDPRYADVVTELKAELQRLRREYGVPNERD